MCPGRIWPRSRSVFRDGRRYDMGPDIVQCVAETPNLAIYNTIEPTAEGWDLQIIARRTDSNVDEKVGQEYAIRWGFVD